MLTDEKPYRQSLLIAGLILLMALSVFTQAPQADVVAPFPRTYPLPNGGHITLFQPQIESWNAQTHIVALSAVAYSAKPADKPIMGSIKIEADTEIAIEDRLVRFKDFTIPEVNFTSLSRDDSRMISTALQAALPEADKMLGLDRVFAAVDKSQLASAVKNAKGIKADPPKIFYSETPAVIVVFDGEPVWAPIKDVDLKFAVNTNWDLFQQISTKTFYLRKDANWFKSDDLKTGWTPAGTLPESFAKLPADDNWKDVRANIPGKALAAGKAPQIFVSTEPAELIVTGGRPKYSPVPNTALLWVNNTESDVFRNGQNGNLYYLVAGRWFSAPALTGPWTFATPDLPADFQKISIEHPRSRVLASVPGTQQATEAVLQARVPITARVSKSQLKAPEVIYQGDPKFEPIEGTMLTMAVNTDREIIQFRGIYYMCYQGIWFTSSSPTDYWTVASEVPKEIYDIPASSPVHNVTYVTVQDDDPNDDLVTASYEPGYTGTEVAWGVPVWGTGWYYPPYLYYGGYYPIYYPWHHTYGLAAWYNPYLGVFGRGAVGYGPDGGLGFGASYNPRNGAYLRAASVYGARNSSSTFAEAYSPRAGGMYAQTRQSSNVYGNWGSSYVQRGDNWAQTAGTYNYRTGNSNAAIGTGEGRGAVTRSGNRGQTTVVRNQEGEIFAGHDGHVYRRKGNGYQRYDNSGNWVNSSGRDVVRDPGNTIPTAPRAGVGRIDGSTYNQLNRDASARREGARRAQALQNYRSNMGGRAAAGSFRGGGGRR